MRTMTAKEAGAATAVRRFLGEVVSNQRAERPAARWAQRLFSTRVKPSDTRIFSRVNLVDAVRDGIFGSPINVYREMRRYGHTPAGYDLPLALRRFYYRSVVPPGSWRNMKFWDKALHAGTTGLGLAVPALELYGAATADREHRGEAVGRAVASVAAAPFAMRLGIPGSLLASAVANVGGAVGRRFDPRLPPAPPDPDTTG